MGRFIKENLITGSRSGFTLIELIIVFTIIGLLAVLAMGSFGAARKQARLDIAADSLATLIKEQQGKTQSGRQVGDVPSCYGVVFQKLAPYVQTVALPYRAIANDSTAKADYCDATGTPTLTPFESFTKDFQVQSLEQGSAKLEKLVVMFKSPFGFVLETNDLSQITDMRQQPTPDQNPLKIFLNQVGANSSDDRGVEFDALSGTVSRIKPL